MATYEWSIFRCGERDTNTTTTGNVTWNPWHSWNEQYTATGNCNAKDDGTCSYTIPTSNLVSGQTVWVQWCSDYVYAQTPFEIAQTREPIHRLATPAERERARLLAEDRRRQEQEKDDALKRAESLMLTFLTGAQRASYAAMGSFEVNVKGRVYQIGKQGKYLLRNGHKIVRYCIHTDGGYHDYEPVPLCDELLGLKLMLEANETEFLRVANATRLAT